ncbi:hypothetical protein GW17_00047572 [Ensete ventricosum]|nr:hypothetical protein GW17_00047572 [Ensete ventricosum]
MGRSDSSKPTPDGQPRQHFGGSHVSPRDQVDSPSVIRGGGPGTTLPGPTPINIAWRAMPSPYAAAAACPPYVSATTRGTTKVLGVRTSSPLTSIKHPFRQQVKERREKTLSRTLPPFSKTLSLALPGGQFDILLNLGIGGASLGHPSHPQSGLCAVSSSPRRPKE